MKHFKTALTFTVFIILFSCGKNEPDVKTKKESNITEAAKDTNNGSITIDSSKVELASITKATNINTPITASTINSKANTTIALNQEKTTVAPVQTIETVIKSPLKNLLNNAEVGKTYTKKELMEQYKFPKEAVDLIKQVTCVGPNKMYFKWGSTWLVEKVSDAEFENGTLIFAFKQNKTYVSGGAIGIKYNKKIYTELILNNGAAYIPTVKGYHWDINK
jgi:hypothetical protein